MQEALKVLKKNFGFENFRKPQGEIVDSILSGRDTLAIMPTGGGKSLCYQLPALMFESGVTLVVSPLIALMKDQVDSLKERGIPAAMINSSQSWDEQREVLSELSRGTLKLAYVSPERFRASSFTRALSDVKVALLAIDEAHCISQWGHDFRPDYMRLGEVLKSLGRPPCAAFTATATPEVRADILSELKMQNPAVFVSGFARSNLSFNVFQAGGRESKRERLLFLIDKFEKGIIYCATRKSVEEVSGFLKSEGIRHIYYHGGMDASSREKAQNKFMGGGMDIAVATNAFGMGIDRSDIRFVCHYELTGSIEALYQEWGRAGRDGEESHCEMFFSYADKRVQEFFIDGSNPDAQFIRKVYSALCASADIESNTYLSAEEIAGIIAKGKSGNSMAVYSALAMLRRQGYIERFDAPGSRSKGTKILDEGIRARDLELDGEMLLLKRRRDENKLKEVLSYAYSDSCRQEWILRYFGQDDCSPCSKCDICSQTHAQANPPSELSPEEILELRKMLSGVARMSFRNGDREWNPRFGKAVIISALMGSRNERILKFGLDKLSTHGILKAHGKDFTSALFDSAVRQKFLKITGGDYPLVQITDAGVSIMLGETEKVLMAYPREKSKSTRIKKLKSASAEKPILADYATDELPEDEALYKKMTDLRNKMRVQRGVAAYQIFPNTVLKALADLKPSSVEEAMAIKGIGEAKAKTCLPPFLELIAAWKK